jgi:hypothetical protein
MADTATKLDRITHLIRHFPGGSHPSLIRADDGQLYIAKFSDNPQGPNLLFNECMGAELYRECGLQIPSWKALLVTRAFLDSNSSKWTQAQNARLQPPEGLCFGSLFLGGGAIGLSEILAGNSFRRVRNHESFYLAWIIDICGRHSDNRQAIFTEQPGGALDAFFVDHGHLFGGPKGEDVPHFLASLHLDRRIYQSVCSEYLLKIQKAFATLHVDRLWRRAQTLPDEWKTVSALESFKQCLDRLSDARIVQGIVDTVIAVSRRDDNHGQIDPFPQRSQRVPVLRLGIQAAELDWPFVSKRADYSTCAKG